jgi:hypothetical protein
MKLHTRDRLGHAPRRKYAEQRGLLYDQAKRIASAYISADIASAVGNRCISNSSAADISPGGTFG